MLATMSTGAAVTGDAGEEEKRAVGRAMRMTPARAKKELTCSFRVKGSWSVRWQMYPETLGARKEITVASASGRYIIEYHMPNMPKNPESPRTTSSHRTSLAPRGASGTFFQYM